MTVLLVAAIVIVLTVAIALVIRPYPKRVPPARPRRDTTTILNDFGDQAESIFRHR